MIEKQQTKFPFQDELPAHQVKILLVDDREENLISLASLLETEDEHIEYIFARSGEEALKVALKEELALILLDVQMPGMNGYEVAHYLRNTSRTRSIPIIFVTAIDAETTRMVEGFEAGAVDFLFKPLHPFITKAKVAAFVRFYLQKKELEQANKYVLDLNRELEGRVKERTKDLTRINNDLDNFIYTASHDLKAPINNIEGLMKLISDRFATNPDDQEGIASLMKMVNESVERFKNTLKDLTEVAKAQSEEVTDESKVSFEEMLSEVKQTISSLVQEYDATIIEDFSRAPEIHFSRKNLRSIIYNLVSNAIKYSSPDRPPVIKISSSPVDSYTLLTVEDNGLGIKKEVQDKVFGMFKRLHSHVEGTGVGMAIVKRIVENNGGRIELESEPGKGTLFNIYLKG
jgi:two-component system sensor histidine kinase/response regulator